MNDKTGREVMERLLAVEGAVQQVMAIVSSALPHTTGHFDAINNQWHQIISDIKRDCDKAK